MKKYHIGKSEINGKGIILDKDLKRDEIIFRFTGDSIKNRLNWYHGKNWLQVGYLEWIIPKHGSAGVYINHSCNPNAGLRGRNTIVAMRPLKKGEEVVIDYALNEMYPLWHMKCTCRSKNCRKLVKPYIDLPAQRQKKYLKYTAKYLKDMSMHLNWDEYMNLKKRK